MSIIATLTATDTGFTGQLHMLTVHTALSFVRTELSSDKAPDYRVLAGSYECGAAWTRTSHGGRRYIAVKLDDPGLAAPVYANVVETEDGGHILIWSR